MSSNMISYIKKDKLMSSYNCMKSFKGVVIMACVTFMRGVITLSDYLIMTGTFY